MFIFVYIFMKKLWKDTSETYKNNYLTGDACEKGTEWKDGNRIERKRDGTKAFYLIPVYILIH